MTIEQAINQIEYNRHILGLPYQGYTWRPNANTIACDLALEALREKQERDKGCAWCKAEYTIIDDDFGQPIRPKMIHFCWRCGKRLEVEHDG